MANQALVLWHLGEEEEARRSSAAALALAERLGHSYSLAFARVYAARLHQSRGDVEATAEHARAVIALSQEKGYFWITQGHFFLGCFASEAARRKAEGGDPDADELESAKRSMLAGLEGYAAAGARLSLTYMLAQLVQLHLAAEEPLREALALARERGDRALERRVVEALGG